MAQNSLSSLHLSRKCEITVGVTMSHTFLCERNAPTA